MQDTLKSLRYAVRPRTLAKYLGILSLMAAALALAPLAVSLWFAEYELSTRFLTVIAVLIVLGLPSLRLSHPADIQANESLTITALVFILTPIFMIYPMMGSGLSMLDAWFEAVSAITTTGLSTVNAPSTMPHTFLFARAWMQWVGGLGIVVLTVAIVINHPIALRRLVNPGAETMLTTTRVYARRMLAVYVALTLGGLGLLMLLMDDAFLALTHTLSAVSTGGFSALDQGLAQLPGWTQFGVTLLGLCGAIPFILYYRLAYGNWREVFGDMEVRTLLSVTVLICLLLSLSLKSQAALTWQEAFRHGVLLGTSAQTTTGFSSLDIKELNTFAIGLLMVAMISGGSIGSTAGGFKILRLLIMLRLLQLLLQRSAMPPHAISEPRLGDKVLEDDEIQRALLLIILFIAVVLLSWLAFLAYGYPPLYALFEVCSAAGTVGLSTGITSHELEPLLKGVLCINMLLGRVEIIALLIILYPGTWLGKRME